MNSLIKIKDLLAIKSTSIEGFKHWKHTFIIKLWHVCSLSSSKH